MSNLAAPGFIDPIQAAELAKKKKSRLIGEINKQKLAGPSSGRPFLFVGSRHKTFTLRDERGNGTGNFDYDQGAVRRGCNDCTVGLGRSPYLTRVWGTKLPAPVRTSVRRPRRWPAAREIVGALRQSRRLHSPRRLCCEGSLARRKRRVYGPANHQWS